MLWIFDQHLSGHFYVQLSSLLQKGPGHWVASLLLPLSRSPPCLHPPSSQSITRPYGACNTFRLHFVSSRQQEKVQSRTCQPMFRSKKTRIQLTKWWMRKPVPFELGWLEPFPLPHSLGLAVLLHCTFGHSSEVEACPAEQVVQIKLQLQQTVFHTQSTGTKLH